jgi:predicted GIY-YIG superfamily endonuclease
LINSSSWGVFYFILKLQKEELQMQKYSVYRIINLKEMGVYYGYTNNFMRRFEEHTVFIKNKNHPNENILKASRKYQWTDFIIEEVERFNLEKEAKMKEEELIIKALNDPNYILYNAKINRIDGENLMMAVEKNLSKKFFDYKRKNNLNKSELTRKIFEYYFDETDQKITWSDEEIKNKEKQYIGVRVNNDLLRRINDFSKVKKKNKNVIYHTAMEQFFDEYKT